MFQNGGHIRKVVFLESDNIHGNIFSALNINHESAEKGNNFSHDVFGHKDGQIHLEKSYGMTLG